MRDFVFDLQRFDNIYNYTDGTLVSGTSGADTIYNDGSSVSINAGAGNDSIYNRYTTDVTINAGAGNDTVYSWGGQKGTIDGGSGNDYIHIGHWVITDDNWFYGIQNLIKGGEGNDSIRNWGASATVNGGSGNDSLLNYGEYSTVIGGTGNDTIYNNWDFSTNSLHSADYAWNAVFKYDSGDGNDIIYGFKADSTLSISGGSYSTTKSGSDIIVTVDDGKITLVGAANLSDVNIKFQKTSVSIPSGAYTYNGHSYYVYSNVVDTWEAAKAYCESRGGHLAVINNAAENTAIYDYIRSKGYTCVFFGLSDVEKEGTWTWVDGTEVTYTNWANGQPDSNDSNEDYGMFWDGNYSGKWNDGNFTSDWWTNRGGKVFICEWDTVTTSGGDSKLITLTSGNDTYGNSVSGVTISALGGNDSVKNFDVSAVSINGGAGNDDLSNRGGNNITLTGGDGKDSLWNEPNDGGKDALNISIVGGAGDDSINNFGNKATLSGGTGNDTILNYGAGYRGGELVFDSVGQSVKIYGDDGDDYISNSGDRVTISAGAGNDTISNNGSNVSINAGTGNDSIYNAGANVSIDAGDGSDTIDNSYVNDVLVNAGAGNDSISNLSAWNSTINAGDGNDTIVVPYRAYQDSINGGSGNDRISLISGTGDDYYGNNTVKGGTGNDTIYGNSDATVGSVYQYSPGDGNDKIYGLQALDLFVVGNGSSDTYFSVTSGNNIIVTVGEGKISLMGAASLSAVNILGTYNNPLLIRGTSGADSINNTLEGATINALGGNDTINNYADSVSIDAGAGNDKVFNGDYTGTSFVTINTGAGNDYIYNDWSNVITIEAGSGDDTIYNHGTSVKIEAGAGNDSIFNHRTDALTINGGAGNDSIFIDGANSSWYSYNVTINGGLGNDVISLSSYASLNVIQYKSDDGNDKIYGLKSTDTLSISGDSYSTTKSGKNIIVTVGEGKISLIGAASLSAVNIGGKEDAKNEWKLDGTTATYGTSSNTLIKVTNVKSLDGISLSGNVVTVAKAAVNAKTIKLTGDGYTLALADDVTKRTTKAAAWSYSSGTATYKSSYKTAGYTLASNAKSITYSKATTASTLATVEGVKSKSGLSVSGTTITVANASVDAKKITLTGDGYKLALADDVTKRTTKPAAWSYSSGTATYKGSYKTAGYLLASNAKSISYYSTATTASTLASVKGAVSDTGLSASGKKFTLKASALSKKVTISGSGYEFDFASDYKNATITGSAKADSISARGSKVSINAGKGDDTITMRGTTSVTGGAGADTFVYKSGKHVIRDYKEEDTISITGTASVTTSGSNVIFTVGSGKITVTGGKDKTITYTDNAGEHTYPEFDDGIKFNDKTNTITLTENYSEDDFDLTNYDNKYQTVDASAVQYGLKITGNKLKNLIVGTEDDDAINGGAGVDIITGGAGNDTLIGGKGNDTLTGGDGDDVFVWNKGDGNDLITDYTDEDTIFINGDTVTTKKASGDNLIFTLAGKNKITVQGGAYKIISYTDNSGEHTYSHFVTYNDAGTSAKLKSGYSKKSFKPSDYAKFVDTLATINASAVTHAMSIVGGDVANSIMGTADEDYINGGDGKDTIRGGDGNDSLIGGGGNDYLYGGEGNDTLWGGKGNDYLYGGEGEDIFLYKPGESKDRIYDYNPAVDTIKLLSGTVDNVESAGSDIVFTIGTGKIILDNAAGNYAKIVDSNGNTLKEYFPKTKG